MRKCVVRTVSSRRGIDFPVPPLEEVPPLSASVSCCARAPAHHAHAHTHARACSHVCSLAFLAFCPACSHGHMAHVAVASFGLLVSRPYNTLLASVGTKLWKTNFE